MSLKYYIGALLKKPQGSKEEFDIDEAVVFKDASDPVLAENVKARARVLKLPHEFSVELRNLHTAVNSKCSRCLISFAHSIDIPSASREFLVDLPEESLEAGEDFFYVDQSRNEIDLYDMVRQEVVLHFPIIRVCFPGCKGLCDKCGVNLNETTCSCIHEAASGTKPFRFLKPNA